MKRRSFASVALLGGLFVTQSSHAVVVSLQEATATFSQSAFGDFSIARAINGTTADDLGWAIYPNSGVSQTAVFETTTDVGLGGGSEFTFTLTQTHSGSPRNLLGRFRLSVTTDDRTQFADGLASGGDVTANWTILDPSFYSSANGLTLTKQGDNSLLASGTIPATDTFTIKAQTLLTGITGIRLEAIADATLPGSGPGRSDNGNFVVSEFEVSIVAVPEPVSAGVTSLVLLAGVAARYRRGLRGH